MLNRKLLLVSSGADAPSTIGVAGGQGFGVGVYPGSKAELAAMQLTPISGFDNPSSAHYGNYQHVYLSTMCCVPAFCYRLGQPTAPSYSMDGANALEVKSAFEFPQYIVVIIFHNQYENHSMPSMKIVTWCV